MTPHKLHRLAAALEMATWALLILGMVMKYSGITEVVVPITGSIHGFGFLCFVVMTLLIWINNRWPLGVGLTGLLVSVVPFAAWPFTVWLDNRGYLEGGWRYKDTDTNEKPRGFVNQALYQAVQFPLRSIIVILIIVTIVFSVLLMLGPPVSVEEVINE